MHSDKPLDPEDLLLEAGLLLDVYGMLLTERQRTFMRLHFEEDLSFSGIAREFGITRQAVHDSVRHAMQTLKSFEDALGLAAKAQGEQTESRLGDRQIVERIEAIRQRLENGADSAQVTEELTRLVALLKSDEPTADGAAVGGV